MPKFPVLIVFTIISFILGLVIPRTIFAYHFRRARVLVSKPTFNVFPSPSLTTLLFSSPSSTPRSTATPSPRISSPSPSAAVDTTIENYLLTQINAFRASKGLTHVTAEAYTCNFARIRAAEIADNFSHDGFRQRIDKQTLPYPTYHEVTENIAMTNDYHNVVDLWINSPSHAANMEKDTPNVCVEKAGNYYAYEGWRP
jgi:uncharacterized protein YkwD